MKKILFGLGSLAIAIMPIVAIVSCTTNSKFDAEGQKRVDEFEDAMTHDKNSIISLTQKDRTNIITYSKKEKVKTGDEVQDADFALGNNFAEGQETQQAIRAIIEPRIKNEIAKIFKDMKDNSTYTIDFSTIEIQAEISADRQSIEKIKGITYTGNWTRTIDGKTEKNMGGYSLQLSFSFI